MFSKSAKGVRGTLILVDGRCSLRVIRDTGGVFTFAPIHTDYEIIAGVLPVEITSDYFVLIEPGPDEAGKPCVDYRYKSREASDDEVGA